mmetsp:Transcript_35986/g.83723  ORF Transcript_35986/g.83723 Transcript_35986/m.83723 type:complete len:101 (-) Transcript_35986:214-516(-)
MLRSVADMARSFMGGAQGFAMIPHAETQVITANVGSYELDRDEQGRCRGSTWKWGKDEECDGPWVDVKRSWPSDDRERRMSKEHIEVIARYNSYSRWSRR